MKGQTIDLGKPSFWQLVLFTKQNEWYTMR